MVAFALICLFSLGFLVTGCFLNFSVSTSICLAGIFIGLCLLLGFQGIIEKLPDIKKDDQNTD